MGSQLLNALLPVHFRSLFSEIPGFEAFKFCFFFENKRKSRNKRRVPSILIISYFLDRFWEKQVYYPIRNKITCFWHSMLTFTTCLSDKVPECVKILWNMNIKYFGWILKKWKNGRFFYAFFLKYWLPLVTSNWLPRWLPQAGGTQRYPEKKTCLGGRGDYNVIFLRSQSRIPQS